MIWFFVGDVIEWLESGLNISGVQRVALELLFAADMLAESDNRFRIGVCTFDPHRTELIALPTVDTLAYFRHFDAPETTARATFAQRLLHLLSGSQQPAPRHPPPLGSGTIGFGADDHILFLGFVWAPAFIPLFRRLTANGTRFSVLVYDLIQIQRTDLVGEAMGIAFAAWLEAVLQTASAIYVSSAITQSAVIAWAESRQLGVAPAIMPLRFGTSHLAAMAPGRLRPAVRRRNYALSVGTIDRRKNQAMLFGIWRGLIDTLGAKRTPQLVLVGRLDLPEPDRNTLRLIEQNRIVILEDATDAEVAALYANCRFTLFPSLAEGYGLPVAESLRFGKVCITSDLPEVREFAGDLVWYFPPGAHDVAMTQIRRAISSPEQLATQERKIAAEFVPPLWHDAALSMLNDVLR